jgi:cytoplasmic tRNA 2-thiolation protein 2
MPKDSADLTSHVLDAEDAESPASATEPLAPRLCYACHTTLTSRSSRGARRTAGIGDGLQNVTLPGWVGRNIEAGKGQGRPGMREQIQEFLLDDEEGST